MSVETNVEVHTTAMKNCILQAAYGAIVAAFLPSFAWGQKSDLEISPASTENVSIVDEFRGSMLTQWRWLRENPDGWKFSDSGLRVLVEPGNMWGKANDAKNILLFPIPESLRGSVDVRVQLEHHPKKRWEQANLVWYSSDADMVKIGLEIEHGKTNIVMGREEGDRTRTIAIIPYADPSVVLRLVVRDGQLEGFYREPANEQWRSAGKANLPGDPSFPPHISLQFYQGEPDSDRWATVTRFEMKQP